MSTQLKEENRAEQQAIAQIESIVEMVAALDRESAAAAYVSELTSERVIELLELESEDINPTDEDLREQLVNAIGNEEIEPDDFFFNEDDARQEIQEDPLSLQVRSDWYAPGETNNDPAEFELLLCTGGPAVRIVGDIDRGSPSRPRIEYQDWGTPWTEYFPTSDQRDALQTYCEQFYFGD